MLARIEVQKRDSAVTLQILCSSSAAAEKCRVGAEWYFCSCCPEPQGFDGKCRVQSKGNITEKLMVMLALRPYQQEAIDAIIAAEGRGIRRPLLALPTGTGKTVVFAHLIQQRRGRSLVLVHRDELIWQAAEKLQIIAPDLDLGIVKAAKDEVGASCVLASVQTLSRENRLARLPLGFQTVIVDEAHHGVAETYRRVLTAVGAFEAHSPLTVGVTATPMRGDHVGLDAVFQEIVYHKSILEMILADYLADLRGVQVGLQVDFRRLHTRAGDFIDSEIEELLLEADAPEHICNAYRDHALGRKALLFTPTVSMAMLMAATLKQDGVSAEMLCGATPLEERRAILSRLRSGETMVVCNCAVLTEGFDEPSVDSIIIMRPTKSPTLYTQMIGRGTRLFPGKDDCLVLDLVGATARHDLMSVASLAGLPLEALEKKESLAEAAERLEAERLDWQGKLVAKRVDLFRRRPLYWMHDGDNFVLSLGNDGWMVLSPTAEAAERWTARHVQPQDGRTVVARDLSLAYAQGLAEDRARSAGAGGLVNPHARWRHAPASTHPKMTALLATWGIPMPDGMTAGEAADVISLALLRRAEGRGGMSWPRP
jgi:ATP-dependent helicase IRC3